MCVCVCDYSRLTSVCVYCKSIFSFGMNHLVCCCYFRVIYCFCPLVGGFGSRWRNVCLFRRSLFTGWRGTFFFASFLFTQSQNIYFIKQKNLKQTEKYELKWEKSTYSLKLIHNEGKKHWLSISVWFTCNQVKMHTRTMQLIHKAVVFPVIKIGTSTLWNVLFEQGRIKIIFSIQRLYLFISLMHTTTLLALDLIRMLTIARWYSMHLFHKQRQKTNTITFKLHKHKRPDYQLMLWASTRQDMLTNFF